MDLFEWITAVKNEVVALPNTMAEFRVGVEQLSKITKRLATATEGIELVEQHLEASGALDAAKVLNETVVGMERQVLRVQKNAASIPGSQVVDGAVSDLQRGVSEIARWVAGSAPPETE